MQDRLELYHESIRRAETPEEKRRAIWKMRDTMFHYTNHFVRLATLHGVEVEDARRAAEIVKYGVQAADDVKDASYANWACGTTKTSGLQTFLMESTAPPGSPKGPKRATPHGS